MTIPSRAAKATFIGCALICAAPLLPLPTLIGSLVAPAALLLGMGHALTMGNPFPAESRKISKIGLQASVVLLGFSLNIGAVVAAGQRGLLFSCCSIALVFLLGAILRQVLKVRPMTSLLVSTGTAICGGSAIAAMSSAVDAPQEDISVSVGTVFLLNAVALLVFPPLGHMLHLTNAQFGTWAGIAIHDVASVVGAATSFGAGSLAIASSVKLSRVLFLIPVTLLFALRREKRKVAIPWFVGLFILASIISSAVPAAKVIMPDVRLLATAGFALSLYLIGAGLNRENLRAVGFRPMLQGVILWVFISTISFIAVKAA